jgi:hypothetical protein
MVFLQEEMRCLRRLFNAKWDASRAAKQRALDRIDERLGRIVEIRRELTKLAVEEGAGEPPPPAPQHVPGCFYNWTPEEEMVALTPVKDEEVKGKGGGEGGELGRGGSRGGTRGGHWFCALPVRPFRALGCRSRQPDA